MIIKVTANDIAKGSKFRFHGTLCPVARALKRAGFTGIGVGATTLWHGKKSIPTPAVAAEFIRNFDWNTDEVPQPFSFEIPWKKPAKKVAKKKTAKR